MLLFLAEAGFIFCVGQVVELFIGIYFNTKNTIPFVAYFVLFLIDQLFWASMVICFAFIFNLTPTV